MSPLSDDSFRDGVSDDSRSNGSDAPFTVTFPQEHDPQSLQQDEEYAEVHIDGKKQSIRIHDYTVMYAQPGLYEYIVHERLACDSPRILVQSLKEHLASPSVSESFAGPLTILDVAAGNGIVGAELRKQLAEKPGIRRLIGTDLLESARSAALRDRPNVYDDYVAADLTRPHESGLPSLSDVVVICAALGPADDDLPLEAVDGAIALLRVGGLLTLTVNAGVQRAGISPRYESFLASVKEGGRSHWECLEEVARKRYKHRKSVQGKWIYNVALIYKKLTPESVGKEGKKQN